MNKEKKQKYISSKQSELQNKKVMSIQEVKHHIRKLTEADILQVKTLIDQTVNTCYAPVYPENAVRFFKNYHSIDRIKKDADKCLHIVLENEGEIIGVGALKENKILRVFIHPSFQGDGYGKSIMQYLEQAARNSGLKTVFLDISLPSKGFYKKMGYEIYEELFEDVGERQSLHYMKGKKKL